MKTKAAVLIGQNKPLEIRELNVPNLNPGQVLVKVAYSGICQNQLNEFKGVKGHDPFIPHTMGHEASGIVLNVGEGVTKVKPGDHVVLSWIKGKGIDVPCTKYNFNGEIVNSGAISTFMEKTVISENRVVPIPKEMPLKEAAILGCAIPTGAGVILNEMKLEKGNSIAVFGIGGVGLSSLIAAKMLDADPIIAVDVHENKLELAKHFGATHLIHAKNEDPIEKIKEITSGKGVDFSFESAGRKEVMETAFQSVKMFGGLCVIAGNVNKGDMLHINPYDLIQGKRIIGTWGGASKIDQDIAQYVKWFMDGKLKLDRLVTHEIRLEEINDLFKELESGNVGRGMIAFPNQ